MRERLEEKQCILNKVFITVNLFTFAFKCVIPIPGITTVLSSPAREATEKSNIGYGAHRRSAHPESAWPAEKGGGAPVPSGPLIQ